MTGRTMMPFRVSSDFNLGLFLKNEKSALKLTDSNSRGSESGSGEHLPPGGPVRFKQVDEYVTHEYWSLDIEFLLSCLIPIIWSITGIYLLGVILPLPCIDVNRDVIQASLIVFTFNITVEFVSIIGLVGAKYCKNWYIKVVLLNAAIGMKLILCAVNFVVALICVSVTSCGPIYSSELHEYDGETYLLSAMKHKALGEKAAALEPSQKLTMTAIIDGFRYYDTKITALNQIFASVGQCVGAMILLVKRNDIKMYVLWRLSKLDQYIDEMHSHM